MDSHHICWHISALKVQIHKLLIIVCFSYRPESFKPRVFLYLQLHIGTFLLRIECIGVVVLLQWNQSIVVTLGTTKSRGDLLAQFEIYTWDSVRR